MEQWKDIPGYEGIYQASTQGRIRSVDGKVTYSVRHGRRVWKGRVLKYKRCRDYTICGYRVSLWKDKKCHDYLVARLVATTFLGESLDTSLTVNHKDGNRLNNNIKNLEWLTIGDNIRDGFRTGLFHNSQKSVALISGDGEHIQFPSMAEACRFLGKSHGYLSNRIRKGYPNVLPSGFTVQVEGGD